MTLPQSSGTLATQEWVTANAGSGGGGGVGESLEGELVVPVNTNIIYPDKSERVTAGTGAEIFNDYRDRTFAQYSWDVTAGNVASGDYSHAEGCCTTAKGKGAHAEGYFNNAYGDYSHVEGYKNEAGADATCTHVEGDDNEVYGAYSHGEGYCNLINAVGDHASALSLLCSHVEGM